MKEGKISPVDQCINKLLDEMSERRITNLKTAPPEYYPYPEKDNSKLLFIGKDGRDYSTEETLQEANRVFKSSLKTERRQLNLSRPLRG